MTLEEALQDPERRRAVIAGGATLVEAEVASKRGLSGVAIRTGFATVQRFDPTFVPRALASLMPEFAPAIDPLFATARESGDVERWFVAHAGQVADALLSVTDARAERADHRLLLQVYRKLRGRAREQVMQAAPGLARLVLEHVP